MAIGSGPIWVGLLQSVIARQVPKLVWWQGTALAIAGLALMLLGKGVAPHLDITGLLLCLAAGLTYTAYTLTRKHLVGITTSTLATAWHRSPPQRLAAKVLFRMRFKAQPACLGFGLLVALLQKLTVELLVFQ